MRWRWRIKRTLVFDKRLEAREGLIPLARDAVEVMLHGVERTRIENELALATGTNAVDHTGALEHSEVLGDGLAG